MLALTVSIHVFVVNSFASSFAAPATAAAHPQVAHVLGKLSYSIYKRCFAAAHSSSFCRHHGLDCIEDGRHAVFDADLILNLLPSLGFCLHSCIFT